MRELDELTRRISRSSTRESEDMPREVPQIVSSLRRESSLLGEWDNIAAEVQREEIIVRISELESLFVEYMSEEALRAFHGEVASLQAMLAARREDVSAMLAANITRLRQFKNSGTRFSHVQKDQIKIDMFSMKSEIKFLDQQSAELDKYLGGDGPLEDDSRIGSASHE
jgi:hypothetical protein